MFFFSFALSFLFFVTMFLAEPLFVILGKTLVVLKISIIVTTKVVFEITIKGGTSNNLMLP